MVFIVQGLSPEQISHPEEAQGLTHGLERRKLWTEEEGVTVLSPPTEPEGQTRLS